MMLVIFIMICLLSHVTIKMKNVDNLIKIRKKLIYWLLIVIVLQGLILILNN